jgi:hypothetical protein
VEGIRKAYPRVIARSAKRDEAIQSGSTTGLLRPHPELVEGRSQ